MRLSHEEQERPDRPRHEDAAVLAERAFVEFRQGRHESALTLAEKSIALLPENAPALWLAATSATALKLDEKAEALWRRLIAAQPGSATAHNNLGVLLFNTSRLAEAERSFNAAISLQPNYPDALVNLGNVLSAAKETERAEAAYRRALELAPQHLNGLYNLALLLTGKGNLGEAEALFREALRLDPTQADVYNDLGNLLADRLQEQEAENAYRRAIGLSPSFSDAHFNLGVLLLDTRRYKEALIELRRVIEINPDHASAINALGNILMASGNAIEAEKAYRRALALRPDSANGYNNLGNLLMETGRLLEAEEAFRRATALQPDYGHALGQAVTCARRLCSWATADADEEAVIEAIDNGITGIPPLLTLALANMDPARQRLAAALASQEKLEAHVAFGGLWTAANRTPGERLRIGYLSADFHEHATMFLLAGVLENHDKEKFSVHGYSYGPVRNDNWRSRAIRAFESFTDLAQLSDRAAAERIASDSIDILIDLKGFTQNFRLGISAWRPAPVIVNWLGYPGTLGSERLADYIIGDPIVTPTSDAKYYAEKIAQMPHCYQPNDRQRVIGPLPSRVDAGLPDQAFVFCSFNQGYKLNPETYDVWCQLLDAIPDSVLWLLASSPATEANLRLEAAKRGISPERLVFATPLPHPEHLGRLQLADLALDVYPYTSHTTGSDALWAGVPIVTRTGATFASRVAASLLHAVGLPELVATSWHEYFELARGLAADRRGMSAIRKKLAVNRIHKPLFDTVTFTRDLEALLKQIWISHGRGERVPILAPAAKGTAVGS